MPHPPHRSPSSPAAPSPSASEVAPDVLLDDLVQSVERLNAELASVHQSLRELTEKLGGATAPTVDGQATPTARALSFPASRGDHLAVPASGDELPNGSETTRAVEVPHSSLPTTPTTTGVPHTDLRQHVADLSDVPLLSVGEIDVLLGPVATLSELDEIERRVNALAGVDAVSVTAFVGREVLLTVTLERPTPLAGLLRTDLGRPVASCRLAEGRIVLAFDDTAAGS
jgi:hypothetical protein